MLGRRQTSVSIRQRLQGNRNQENVATGKAPNLLGAKPMLGKLGGNTGIQTRARTALGDRSNLQPLGDRSNIQNNENIPKKEPPVKKEISVAPPKQNVANTFAARARRFTKPSVPTEAPQPKVQAIEDTRSDDMEIDEPSAMEEDMMVEPTSTTPTKSGDVELLPDLSLPTCERIHKGRDAEREYIRGLVLKKYGGGVHTGGPTSGDKVTNPDLNEMGNSQMVSEYVYEIFDYLQDLELQRMPLKPDFMDHCTHITTRMRHVLVDWMVQIHSRFEMLAETLYLGIGMMDRYLHTSRGADINKGNLQLLGVTAMMVASKFEEMYPPDVTDFTYVTGNAYSCKELREFEWTLLSNIGFFCTIPTPITFLRRFSRLLQVPGEIHSAAKYFLELSSCEYSLCAYPGCLRAAAAICLSMALLKYGEGFNKTSSEVKLEALIEEAWLPNLQFSAAYNFSDIVPVARKMAAVVERQAVPSKYRSIYKKYVAPEVHAIALRPEFQSVVLKEFADPTTS